MEYLLIRLTFCQLQNRIHARLTLGALGTTHALINTYYTFCHYYVISLHVPSLSRPNLKRTCHKIVALIMKRILFGCVGAGLAIGGAYLVYKRWQKYQQQCQEKNIEVCDTYVNKVQVERNSDSGYNI